MKTTSKAQRLLDQIAQIQNMERGTVCRMSGRNHYNHQTWTEGQNVVRYVAREDVTDLQRAIAGFARFTQLTRQYADEIIRLSRMRRAQQAALRLKKQEKPGKSRI
jgi:hypothetical protein